MAEVVNLHLRWWPLLVIAVGIQLSLGWLPTPARWFLVLVCCALALTWTYANVETFGTRSGLALLLGGILANTAVIAANRGMPVDVHALVLSGRSAHTDLASGYLFKHTQMNAHTSLSWLGDRLPIPVLEEVLSFGDVLMLGGLATIAYRSTRPRPLFRFVQRGSPSAARERSVVPAARLDGCSRHGEAGARAELWHLQA